MSQETVEPVSVEERRIVAIKTSENAWHLVYEDELLL